MSETVIPNSNPIADAMLKRTGELLREQRAADPATSTVAEKVIDTLVAISELVLTVSDKKSPDSIKSQLEAALTAGHAKPSQHLRLASYFANEAPEGAAPRYAEVGKEFHGDPDVFPLYFGPSDSRFAKPSVRLTPERISELWNGMPGGYDGFLKQWGYMQFARAVERDVRAVLLAALGLRESDEQPFCKTCNGAGRIVTGTSGRESDGNAPDIEPCPSCEEPS